LERSLPELQDVIFSECGVAAAAVVLSGADFVVVVMWVAREVLLTSTPAWTGAQVHGYL